MQGQKAAEREEKKEAKALVGSEIVEITEVLAPQSASCVAQEVVAMWKPRDGKISFYVQKPVKVFDLRFQRDFKEICEDFEETILLKP